MKKGKRREENRGEEDAHRAAATVLKTERMDREAGRENSPAAKYYLLTNALL